MQSPVLMAYIMQTIVPVTKGMDQDNVRIYIWKYFITC